MNTNLMVIIAPMSLKEVRSIISRINALSEEIGRLLIEIRDLEGWRVLGYQSWTQFLESDELVYSRARCLEFIRAFPVATRLREELNVVITTEVALALARFEPEIQTIAIQTAINHHKPITANRVKDYATVYQEAVATGGYITSSDGEQRAITDAFIAQRVETEISAKTRDLGITGWVIASQNGKLVIEADNGQFGGILIGDRVIIRKG